MINKITRLSIFNTISSRLDYLGKYSDADKVMLFLQKIWPLRAMQSEDSRFSNAYDDIYQHIINNADWNDEYLYLTRLKLLENEREFIIFLETIVHPETRYSKDDIILYVDLINRELSNENVRLVLTDYFEGLPVFKVKSKDEVSSLEIDIVENTIPIFPYKITPTQFPCFVLQFSNWDDFESKTTASLSFHNDQSSFVYIGNLKIMNRNIASTIDSLNAEFYSLSREYCSLGQESSYYERFKLHFPHTYQSILLALRDTALFPKILEEFENDSRFRSSLIRNNEAEQVLRTVRYELEGSNLTNYFKFNFSFKPPYAENLSNLYFDFEYNTEIPHRIIALIGKNGTGKTSILSDLINKFSKQILNNNSDKLPSFGKYFTVSYSVFDRFSVPESNVAFNYIYCGLKKADGLIKSEQEQIEDFFQSANKIKERDLTDRWFKILKNFLSESDLTLIFPDHNEDLPFSMVKFSEKNFNSIKSHFSSGESILIFIMTKIISEIRYDSLILYDEPETHLHPNAISSLMSSLFELVSSFRSFCVIATHSPLIVRELSAKDVYVLKRDNSDLEISKLNQDSFGENLTVITEDIFGNRDVNRHYLQIIENLVNKGYEFDKIIGLIKDDQIPVSLNVILYLRSLISRKYHDEP